MGHALYMQLTENRSNASAGDRPCFIYVNLSYAIFVDMNTVFVRQTCAARKPLNTNSPSRIIFVVYSRTMGSGWCMDLWWSSGCSSGHMEQHMSFSRRTSSWVSAYRGAFTAALPWKRRWRLLYSVSDTSYRSVSWCSATAESSVHYALR